MERRPEPVGGKLQIFQKMEKEPQTRAGSPVLEYHAALITGDMDRLKPLMDQFFQDANVVFEIKKDEMEWQGKSSGTFGLSGTFAPLKPGYLVLVLVFCFCFCFFVFLHFLGHYRGIWRFPD